MPTTFECTTCGKHFASRFSMERHQENQHIDEESATTETNNASDNVSEVLSDNGHNASDSHSIDSNASHSDETHMSEDEDDTEDECADISSSEETSESDSDEESEGEDDDTDVDNSVFSDIINQANNIHEGKREELFEKYTDSGMSDYEASIQAHAKVLNLYQKTTRRLFTEHILKMLKVLSHPVTKIIVKKANDLESEGMDRDEAIRVAIRYRKHLVNRFFLSLNTKSNGTSEDENDDTVMN